MLVCSMPRTCAKPHHHFRCQWGSVLLGCCPAHGGQHIAQLLFLLVRRSVPTLFMINLRALLSLGNLEQLHGTPLVGRKTAHSQIMSRRNLVWGVRRPWQLCLGLLTCLVTLWPLSRLTAMGWRRAMAAALR